VYIVTTQSCEFGKLPPVSVVSIWFSVDEECRVV